MAAKPAGSFLYEEGHRLCVLAGSSVNFRKTDLQGAFSEFGHIVQIETPKTGLAFVVFKDKGDAKEALECMDKKSVNGVQVTVNWAGPKPTTDPRKGKEVDNGETPNSERTGFGVRREILTTTNFERDQAMPYRDKARSWPTQSRWQDKDKKDKKSRSRSGRRGKDRSRSGKRKDRSRSGKRKDKSRSGKRKNRSRSGKRDRSSERKGRSKSAEKRKGRSRSAEKRKGRSISAEKRRGGSKKRGRGGSSS